FLKFLIHKKQVNTVTQQFHELYLLALQYRSVPTKELKIKIEKKFDYFGNQTTDYKKLNLRIQLTKQKKKRLLLFLNHPHIPIHNNQSERDLRPAVIIRKISGPTKSHEGDKSIERHLSVIHTARKQHLNVLETLQGLLTNQVSPFVLTARNYSI
ncbi:MAG TPA: transposase, partial [Candidatus Woesebacteria bacterium]|nr:transposase [Candidatus Woesebacteria bacterium]